VVGGAEGESMKKPKKMREYDEKESPRHERTESKREMVKEYGPRSPKVKRRK
jgi:hypothetical protein